jgi:hypothetical protein
MFYLKYDKYNYTIYVQEKNMDRVELAINIKNEILSLGRDYNAVVPMSISEVKKLNLVEFPQIAIMMEQLYMEDLSYDFKKIFVNGNDITFDPSSLIFNDRYESYLEAHPDEVLIKFITSADKEFLIFVSPVLQIEHLWEFVNEEVEEGEETVDGEDEEVPEEDEEF